MPTPSKGPRLASTPAHERLMMANLATALFQHGSITTTHARAKRVRPLAEKLITFAKRGDLHARRQVMTVIRDKSAVHVLFTEIGPRFATRPGGYTRITRIGPRKGDNAPMAIIEMVEPLAEAVVAEAQGATKRAAREAAEKVEKASAPMEAAQPESGQPDTEVVADEVTPEATGVGAADAPSPGDTALGDTAPGDPSPGDAEVVEAAAPKGDAKA